MIPDLEGLRLEPLLHSVLALNTLRSTVEDVTWISATLASALWTSISFTPLSEPTLNWSCMLTEICPSLLRHSSTHLALSYMTATRKQQKQLRTLTAAGQTFCHRRCMTRSLWKVDAAPWLTLVLYCLLLQRPLRTPMVTSSMTLLWQTHNPLFQPLHLTLNLNTSIPTQASVENVDSYCPLLSYHQLQ